MQVGDRVRVIRKWRFYDKIGTVVSVHENKCGVRLEGSYNINSIRGLYYFNKGDLVVLDYEEAIIEKNNKSVDNKEDIGENDMNTCVENGLTLLNIWYERMMSKIENFETQEIIELKDNDTLCKSLKEHYKAINELMAEAGCDEVSYVKYFTQETAELIKKVRCEWKAEQTKLDNMLIELKALVGTCQTHEDIMNILMVRGVINENYEILVTDKQ